MLQKQRAFVGATQRSRRRMACCWQKHRSVSSKKKTKQFYSKFQVSFLHQVNFWQRCTLNIGSGSGGGGFSIGNHFGCVRANERSTAQGEGKGKAVLAATMERNSWRWSCAERVLTHKRRTLSRGCERNTARTITVACACE